MTESRNVTIFWLCATLALAITFIAVGTVIVLDAVTAGLYNPGRLSLRPGGGVLAILLGVAIFCLVFRRQRLATVAAVLTLLVGLLLSLLPALKLSSPLLALAISPQLYLVLGVVALCLLAALWHPRGWQLGLLGCAVVSTMGLLSLLSQAYPALSGLGLGSMAESNIVVSPLILALGLVLPGLQRVYRRSFITSHRGLLIVGAAGIMVTTLGWHGLRLQHTDQVFERASVLAQHLRTAHTEALNEKSALILRMAERWAVQGALPPVPVLRQEGTSYLRDYPDLTLIGVTSTNLEPMLSIGRNGAAIGELVDLLSNGSFLDWLDSIATSELPTYSPVQSLPGESAQSVLFVPLTGIPDALAILAVVDLSTVYGRLVRSTGSDLHVLVRSNGHMIFDSSGHGIGSDHAVLASVPLDLNQNTALQLDVSMPRGALPSGELYLPPLVLFTGLGLSFLVMLTHLFWRESERRSDALEALNSTLNFHLDQERSLRYTNERILEFSRDILCSISRDGRFLQVSPACESILGYRPDELVGQHYGMLLNPEDRARTEDEVQRLISGEQSKSAGFRTRLRHRDGHLVTLSWTAEWSREDHILFGVGRDISDELAAETLSREREQFFALSPDMFCIVDLNSYFFEVNNTFVETLGYSREQLLGSSYLDLIHAADRTAVTDAVQRLTEGHAVSDLQVRAQDASGEEHWLNINATLSADDLIYVVARDTTEQRRIEQRLRESENLLKMAERVAMIGGWMVDLDSGHIVWSDVICDIHEVPPGHSPSMEEALSYYLPEHRAVIQSAVQTCIKTGIPFDEQLQINTANGRMRWVRVIGHASKDRTTGRMRLQGATQDITHSRQAMDQLRRFAERQATIFESITDAFFTVDRNWRFTFVNTRSEELLRKSRDELLGHSLWELFPAAVGSEFENQYVRAMETGESVFFEAYYQPLDNWLEISAYPSEEGLAVYYRSIRERKEAQQKLEAAMQELERSNRELQDFAFVASHDLQEPLRKIQAFSDRLAKRSEHLTEQDRDYLQRMQSAAGRMQQLIEDLLSYSRVTTRGKAMERCDTNTIVAEVMSDMEASIAREKAQIQVGDLPATLGDATQLRQVIQNLLSNAIKFHAADVIPDVKVYAEDMTDDAWTLVVSDNGIGFDERYAEKLFHPFQRLHQREGYAGTGIGMAIVKKILDRHGATVSVRSQPGSGTTFRIRLKRL